MIVQFCGVCSRYIENNYCPYCKQHDRILLSVLLEGEEITPDLDLLPDVEQEEKI
jgi:recombinational DNA repair protein RecR